MATAIQAIYRDLEYAKTLIKHRTLAAANNDNDITGAGDEESWTFIGDEGDPELARRIAEWEPMAQAGGYAGGEKFGQRSRGVAAMGRGVDLGA